MATLPVAAAGSMSTSIAIAWPCWKVLELKFTAALVWNVGTWWLGIPNSSSHALIGSLIGIAIETALTQGRGMKDGVEWHQIWSVLGSLLVSPLLAVMSGLSFEQASQAMALLCLASPTLVAIGAIGENLRRIALFK